ncbi:hypothetical protein [Aquibacillus kalidii]|uniref:hypothetical protein n=1 Tax=Aquibacillus kalidii TaxID=2762597 RepID=UPI001647A27E|nr:hypothetical protein [Aquibacillus kalidii]
MKKSIYVSMEMQSGTKKLAEALELRGFPVKVKDDFISLRNGSEKDCKELKQFLDELQIPVFWQGEKFQLLTNRFPVSKMKEIIHAKGRNHGVHMEGYHMKWRSFANRRYGIRTYTTILCPYTAIMVKALNEAGIVALTGCNGHGQHSPNFQLSGVYFGVWFSIIQQKYLKDLNLHYKWKVYYRGQMTSGIMAHKASEQSWNMMKVLADCEQMANVLVKHAAEIRELKKNSFKRGMKDIADSLRENGAINDLSNWMNGEVEK